MAWSYDQKKLAGVAFDTANKRIPGVFVYSFDTNRYTRLEDDDSIWPQLHWLSDNRRVIGVSTNAIKMWDMETGESRELLSDTGLGFGVGMPADDSVLYYLSGSTEADIWMATMESVVP